MKRWLKILLVSVAVLLAALALTTYVTLKSVGIIPKKDYDTVAPDLPAFTAPAVLVFSKTNGFRHKEAIPVAKQVLAELVESQGWEVLVTDNAAVHSPELLNQFDVVIWNNVSGDVLTTEQRRALKDWLHAGGGWLGIHASGGDFSYQWDWYVDTLIGAQFVGHTMNPQFQDAQVLVQNPGLTLTAHLPRPWLVPQEEWYAFDANPRDKGYDILLTLDKDSYTTHGPSVFMGNDRMEGEHPIAWRHQVGEGRALYSAIGHQAATYRMPAYQQFLVQAMHWLRNDDSSRGDNGDR